MSDITDWEPEILHHSPNKSTMSETPRELELIDNFYSFVDRISEALNTLLIDQLGEDATWDDHVGESEMPYKFLTGFKPRSEAQKLFAEIWELREEANGLCASLDDHKPAEWAKEHYETAQRVQDYEATRDQQRELMIEAANNFRNSQSRVDSLLRDIKELTAKFTCFKADAITSLKAIDLCILASLTTDKQHLTHRARNFRMRHVHQIILNQICEFGDRKLISYEDDF